MLRFIFAFVFTAFFFLNNAFAESPSVKVNCDDQRHITVNALNYKTPDDWEVWVNGQAIKPADFPLKELVELAVSPTEVKVKWFDSCLNGVFNVTLKPGQTYFIAQDLAIIQLRPSPSAEPVPPSVDQPPTVAWAEEAASQTLTFGFSDYEERMASAKQKYFSPEGWGSFQTSIDGMGILKSTIEYQQIIVAHSPNSLFYREHYARRKEEPPKASILEESEIEPRITKVEMPLLVVFRAGNKKNVKRMCVIVTLQQEKQGDDYPPVIVNWLFKEKDN